MIPEEAVESGARAIYRSVNRSHADTKGWDEVKPNWQRSYRRDAIAALEAAAPFIRAQALEDAAGLATDRDHGLDGAITRARDSRGFMQRHNVLSAARWLRARAVTERGGE